MSFTAVAPPRPASPPPVRWLPDPGLVDVAVACQVAENAARARRLAAICEFYARAEARGGERSPAKPSFFVLTPRQSTTAEFAPALAVTDMTIEIQLDIAIRLINSFPTVWAMCEAGRLDLGRADLLLEAVQNFAHEEDIPRFAALMADYINKFDDQNAPICPVTRSQLQRAARYRKAKFDQKSEEETFAAAFKKRRLSFRPGEDGMGSLFVQNTVTDAMSADYRITLIAKQIRNQNPDETRTLEQLRADITLDLLLGKLEVAATNGMLEAAADEDDPTGHLKYHATGAYARPVINVTVPITTLLGLTEDPALLSGANPIPAELARTIAADPGSTWWRMLTDEARRCVELSTSSYQPTKPIWRETVARDQICIWPTCSRPAVRVQLDHRVEYPAGATSTTNLEPLCEHHHKVKHSTGFHIAANGDGTYTWTTPTGHTWTARPPEQPVAEWPDPADVETTAYAELDDPLISNFEFEDAIADTG